jgi:hypothetical protein
VTPGTAGFPRLRLLASGKDIVMRGYSEFMGYWRRVVYDAGSKSFEARRIDGIIPDAQAHEAAAAARRILAEALCLPPSALSADTPLASLALDSLILECIALHAEEITGREYDRADICALATVRDLELLLSGSQPG